MTLANTSLPTSRHQANPIKVMIVDDSFVVRGVLKRALEAEPIINIVGTAVNGQEGLEKLSALDPDVVILDIEMPVMDGITALPLLLKAKPSLIVIVASTLTLRGAEITMKCLEMGAKDCIPKPGTTGLIQDPKLFQQELIDRVKSLTGRGVVAYNLTTVESSEKGTFRPLMQVQPKAVVIGSSTGGPQALMHVLTNLPATFKQPIFIAQHMPPMFTQSLASHIARTSGRIAAEGVNGEVVQDNRIYIAPGNYHMTVENVDGVYKIGVNQEAAENFCRPSVNPLLRSAIRAYYGQAVCFMLTGLGSDGVQGAKTFVESGGSIIAQDQESSTVWGMPRAVYQEGYTSALVPLKDIRDTMIRIATARNPRHEVRL